MDKKKIIFMGIFLVAFLFIVYDADAYVINGLLDDWGVTPGLYGSSDWVPNEGIIYVEEDQITWFLGPGSGGQKFDAEAMYWAMDTHSIYLAIVTGMGPAGSWSNHPGDIFIDFNDTNSYGIKTVSSKSGTLYKNPSWNNISWWGGVSNPITMVGGTGEEVGATNFVYSYAYPTGQHYVMEMAIPKSYFDSDWLKGGKVHWTQTCGNDSIDLDVPPIPEPASMLLFGLSALGLGVIKRRKNIYG